MSQTASERQTREQSKIDQLHDALDSGTFKQVQRMMNGLPYADIAHLLESSPPATREILWTLVDPELEADVLQELGEDVRMHFLGQMDAEKVAAIAENLDADDIADLLQQLPEQVIEEVLESMSEQNRQLVEQVLSFPEDTAGGLMDTDAITVRPRFTLSVVLRYIRRHETLPDSTDALFVVNRNGEFLGILPVARLLTTDPNTNVREVMVTDRAAIPADMPDKEVAHLFERHNWVSAPVIDSEGKLIGRVTIDDVVDVIREQTEHNLMGLAGLDEVEDTFATVRRTAPRRAMWLGINLITAIVASSVINIFEGTIDKVVALAVLMPIVASMGGVAGSQTLTVVIRGIALGQIGHNNVNWLLIRELRVALLNGLLWSLVMGGIAGWWFGDQTIAIILASAMIINLITAALAGTLLPVILRALSIDPALAGGVALTTVTDVVGFFAFLGLATAFYA